MILLIDALIILIPISFVVLSVWLFWKGLTNRDSVNWKYIIPGIIILLSLFILIAIATIILDYIIIIVLLFAAGTSLVSWFILIFYLPGYRKLVAAILLVLSPLLMYISMNIGLHFTFDEKTEKNGNQVAEALEIFNYENGYYPNDLSELVPTYIDNINEPKVVWGWLYVLEDDGYALGYVAYVDSLGYSISMLRPGMNDWEYLSRSTGPFELGPTPMP